VLLLIAFASPMARLARRVARLGGRWPAVAPGPGVPVRLCLLTECPGPLDGTQLLLAPRRPAKFAGAITGIAIASLALPGGLVTLVSPYRPFIFLLPVPAGLARVVTGCLAPAVASGAARVMPGRLRWPAVRCPAF
jgi:hypothetical protein